MSSILPSWTGRCLAGLIAVGLAVAVTPRAGAAVMITPEPSDPWLGYMNVFELPSNGGGFVFGQWVIAPP